MKSVQAVEDGGEEQKSYFFKWWDLMGVGAITYL